MIPAYREEIRGLTPMRVQRQIWAHCHRFLSDDRQLLVDCDAPITEAEAQTDSHHLFGITRNRKRPALLDDGPWGHIESRATQST